MEVSAELARRLGETRLLGNVGQPYLDYVTVPTAKKMEASINSIKWENTVLEARGDVTEFLSMHHHEADQRWNDFVWTAKALIGELIDPHLDALVKNGRASKSAAASMRFDFINILVIECYKEYTTSEFFDRELDIYLNGHVPCGWQGRYPNGGMIIY